MSARSMNASPADGDSVASTITVMMTETMTRPRTGTPRESVRANIAGNNPSRAVASAVSALISVHPPRQPDAFMIAQAVITTAPAGPRTRIAASAKGADECRSSLFGMMPMMAVVLRTYTMAAVRTPRSAARAMLRSGFSTTAAATDALSTPMNDQNMMETAEETARTSLKPAVSQPARNSSGSKKSQPAIPTSAMGPTPRNVVSVSNRVTSRGPIMFKKAESQIMRIVLQAPRYGFLKAGTKIVR